MADKIDINSTWNLKKVAKDLAKAFENNSELQVLDILKQNSFLFHELYERRYSVQPIFHEVQFAEKLRCDFAWLNDSTDGPEWVLVEVEKPNMELFTKKGEPTQYLSHALEQVRSWRRYFNEHPSEMKRIFGAVARFRYIVVAGRTEEWQSDQAAKWRIDNNKETEFEIRSSGVFTRALKMANERPEEMWSFALRPKTIRSSELESYWTNYKYMDSWRKIIS